MTAIDTIKQNYPILAIADRLGIAYHQKQGKVTASCPFCDADDTHFYLYQDTDQYHCFKCSSHGDQLDLYSKSRGIDAKTLIKELGDGKALMTPLPSRTLHKQPEIKPKSEITEKDHSQLYYEVLAHLELTPTGSEYLESRGINKLISRKYGIVSIDKPDEIGKQLKAKFSKADLLASGLFDTGKEGREYFSFFYPAIIFPHWNCTVSRIESMSTRNLIEGKTKAFKLHNVRTHNAYGMGVLERSDLYVFEGYINALSFEILTGSDSWIVLSGSGFDQAKYQNLQNQFPQSKIILALDPDQAGENAINKLSACTYIDWQAFALQNGFETMPKTSIGKAYDMDDYLINLKTKRGI